MELYKNNIYLMLLLLPLILLGILIYRKFNLEIKNIKNIIIFCLFQGFFGIAYAAVLMHTLSGTDNNNLGWGIYGLFLISVLFTCSMIALSILYLIVIIWKRFICN